MIRCSRFLFYFQYAHRSVKYQGVRFPLSFFKAAATLFLAVSSLQQASVHRKTAQAATLPLVSLISVEFPRCHPDKTEKEAQNQNYGA